MSGRCRVGGALCGGSLHISGGTGADPHKGATVARQAHGQGDAGRRRHPALLVVALVVLAGVVAGGAYVLVGDVRTVEHQEALDPFYQPPRPLPAGEPGEVIRSQPIDVAPPGAKGWRILYRSERADGSVAVSSGMVFAPEGPAPPGGRPVVAWAHPTIGMGEQCAPSRSGDPLKLMTWAADMVANGWVVTATDYAGLGTPGVEAYLIGGDEGRDVLNSVRAARNLGGTHGGDRFAVYGHSQGGHAALFAGQLARAYAPELHLVAVAAAAPAGELARLMSEQYRKAVGWVIGAEVFVAWPESYDDISLKQVASSDGIENYRRIARDCILQGAVEGELRFLVGEQIFARDPISVPSWKKRATENTPSPLPADVPLLIAQGVTDVVVPPGTTAALARRFCDAGSRVWVMWLGQTGHTTVAAVAGPSVTTWLQDRFAGVPAATTCATAPPAGLAGE